MTNNQKILNVVAVIALVLAAIYGLVLFGIGGIGIGVSETPIARSVTCDQPICFGEGGTVLAVNGGGSVEFASGSSLTAASGVNATFDTITATNVVSTAVSFKGATGSLTGAFSANSAAITNAVTASGVSASYVTATNAAISQMPALNVTGAALVNSLIVTGTETASGVSATYLTATNASINSQSASNVTGAALAGSLTVTGTAIANGFSATYLTGTLGTANQPNVTNLGTQAYLTATTAVITGVSGVNATYASITSTVGLTATGPISVAGLATFNDSVYANAYLRSADGTVYVYDGLRVRQETKLDGGAVVTGGLTVNNGLSTDYLTSTNPISMAGATFSGPIKYGTASTVISGSLIAHGFGVTPTVFLIQPATIQSAVYTQTLYGYGCNTVSCTVGISQGDVVTFTTAQWTAGK